MAFKFLLALAIVASALCQINLAFPQGTLDLDDELLNELQEEPHRQVRSVLNVANPAQNLQNEPSLTGDQGGTKDSVYVRKTGPNRKVRSSRWVKFRDRILKGRGCKNGKCKKPGSIINWSYKF
ncbi:uncharacterized protein LOC123320319 [Coccinella septempunctata]|uniref:uncharacterized protein LOC123320319 n=1 Tax=Coccinella septempunctata TaxID=41139 RepID=UPI001D080983|nr:uncharacterized protein LOC123320319 [Coccinella septempunctata]